MNGICGRGQWLARVRSLLARLVLFLLIFMAISDDAGCQSVELPTISWSNNLLVVSDRRLPGGKLEVWYLEAFCRSGAWNRDWRQTTLRHKTSLTSSDPAGLRLEFHTWVEPGVEVRHEVQALPDGLELNFELSNTTPARVDLQWFEPACIRVAGFTGCAQSNYTARSFICKENGLTTLDRLRRTTNALYLGGQVYLPAFIAAIDANPRPICLDHPVNGLIGCYSADNRRLLATASDRTHELFEGVYVCLHSDPQVNGLAPGEIKRRRSRIYLLPNDRELLLKSYRRDFPEAGRVF